MPFAQQDNRLDSLPDGLFTLPALQLLDVSNNKLSSLPYKLWTAPKLREVNASLNLLSHLPTRPDDYTHDSGNCFMIYSGSPIEQCQRLLYDSVTFNCIAYRVL